MRVLLTTFGYDDPGGGTIVPRHLARALVARGHEVTVFHAAVPRLDGAGPYAVRAWDDDSGVHLVGVFNREHGLLDLGHPRRELDDPPIREAFARVVDAVRPDVLHAHNLHNLGASLLDVAFARGLRTLFTPHNFWAICPRNHLVRANGALCEGPDRGGRACAACVGSTDESGHAERRTELRARIAGRVDRIQAVSATVRHVLVASGFPASAIDVVRLGAPAAARIWAETGRERRPGRLGGPLRVGFVGGLLGHKGIEVLAHAANLAQGDLEVHLHGHATAEVGRRLTALDATGRVHLAGAYAHDDLPRILAGLDVAVVPSTVWETAGLVVFECLAGRVPVVAARMGGLVEGVRDGVDGLLVDGRSAPALAAALDRLAGEPGLVGRLQAGIDEPRSFEAYVDDVEAAYRGEPHVDRGPEPALGLRWTGDQETVSSLATINRAVTARLAGRAGFDVERREVDGEALDPPLARPATVEVRHRWPPDLAGRDTGRLALIQPWEFGSIHADWPGPMREHVDEVWVPSEYVRRMYLEGGLDEDRVHVVPNGVDLELFQPAGPRRDLGLPEGTTVFLFVGGTIYRKGVDVLMRGYRRAFGVDDDVALVVKDVSPGLHYKGRNVREDLLALAADPDAPRLVYLDDDLEPAALAALYRAADVLVHPYRGEGFAMPVLEAMACGLPSIITAGGPTDEFCPDEACWRIPSTPVHPPQRIVGDMPTVGPIWVLEPDADHLAALLVEAHRSPAERASRGAAGLRAAAAFGWDAITDAYEARVRALALRTPRSAGEPPVPIALPDPAAHSVLATPAWLGSDRLAEALSAWAEACPASTDVALYLLADPVVDGPPEAWEGRVLDALAASGADLDRAADVAILDHAVFGNDLARLHAAVDAFLPLHPACAGHERLARAAGNAVVEPTAPALRAWLVQLDDSTRPIGRDAAATSR